MLINNINVLIKIYIFIMHCLTLIAVLEISVIKFDRAAAIALCRHRVSLQTIISAFSTVFCIKHLGN